jgi:hypothetical protein
MSKLGEYFHKKYYPDLDINLVEKHLSNPQVFDTAVSFVHKNHYQDLPIENVKSVFKQEHPIINYQQQSDDLMNKYSNLNFVQRAQKNVGNIKLQQVNGDYATHKMAYSTNDEGENIMFPLVVQQGDRLVDFSQGVNMKDKIQRRTAFDNARNYAIKSGEFIPIGNDNQFAEYFSSAGYKKNMGDDIYNDAFNEYLNNSGVNLPETVIRSNQSGQAPPMPVE